MSRVFSTSGINRPTLNTIESETVFNFIASGCVWTGDALGSTKAASMTAGVCYIAGVRLTVPAVTSRTFTASKDVYVDFQNNNDGTASITYTDNTTNAVSPALGNSGTSANTIRNAIVVVGATNIAAATSINQGQETMVLPIASSIPYAVTDSLGNLICPRDPQRKLLGYRQIIVGASATTIAQVTGLTCPVIVPTARKVKITFACADIFCTSATTFNASIWDGVVNSGTQLSKAQLNTTGDSTSTSIPTVTEALQTPAASSKTYNAGLVASAGTANIEAGATSPAFIKVELM